jgi:hypothetical protein
MRCDKSVGVGSVNNYVNFGSPESIRNGNRKELNNCLYSVTEYNGSAHIEINLSMDVSFIHKLHRLGLFAAGLVNRFNVFGAERLANMLR